MSALASLWTQGDAVTRSVALLLLLMSIGSWVVIFWKSWLLNRVRRDIASGVAAFWGAPTLDDGRRQLDLFDRSRVVVPLLAAALARPAGQTLEAHGARASQLTRRLRDALHVVVAELQAGQVLLASVGSTAPFVGLFGTVWGIYHALLGMTSAGGMTIERIAAPVGEALVMTAAGLAVAIPAVLAYNAFGKRVAGCEAELEGFAHDLRELQLGSAPVSASAGADEVDPGRIAPLEDAPGSAVALPVPGAAP